MLATDTVIEYTLPGTEPSGYCQVHIYYRTQRAVVVLTEPAHNPGPSITDALPQIATTVLRRYGLDVERTTWVVHYPEGEEGLPESYDLVALRWDGEQFTGEPEWPGPPLQNIAWLTGGNEGDDR